MSRKSILICDNCGKEIMDGNDSHIRISMTHATSLVITYMGKCKRWDADFDFCCFSCLERYIKKIGSGEIK